MSARVSVVVPTRDRPAALRRCLAALDQQDADIEVIVVDDGSRDAPEVAAVVAGHRSARLVRGGGHGPAAARNLGARAAVGRVVCFTDDDCEPAADWARRLADAVEAGASASAGPTRPPDGAGPIVEAAQLVASYLAEASVDAATGDMRFAPTSNLACRADVFARVSFDEDYPLAAGEDREWCARLLAEGNRLQFVPDAVVHHHQELGLKAFWRQQVRYGRGGWRFHRSREGYESPRWYVGLLRAGFRAGVWIGLLVCLGQVATATGMLAEALGSHRRG